MFSSKPITNITFTCIFSGLLLVLMNSLGNTIGAHRLWAHRSYTASWPLRLVLATLQTMSLTVNSIIVYYGYGKTKKNPHFPKTMVNDV